MTLIAFPRASRTATQIHQPSGSSIERRGRALNPQFQSQGCLPARYAASHGTAGDKDRAPFSNRALLEGFADVIRLQADRLQQSVIFALICMLVPTVIAVTVIGYAVLKPIY